MRLDLVHLDDCNDALDRGFATCRKVALIQEVHRAAASGHVRLFAWSKATDFTRGGCKPELGILRDCAGAGINNNVGGLRGMSRHRGMVDGLCCGRWRRRWGTSKHGTDVIDSLRGNFGAVLSLLPVGVRD